MTPSPARSRFDPPPALRALAFRLARPFAPRGFPSPSGLDLDAAMVRDFGSIVRDFALDASAYRRFKAECGYAERYASYMGEALLDEKLLEHFVSIELLRPRSGETLIDVGGAVSPFADFARDALGCRAFRLDLDYSPGVEGDRIGASADRVPLADASVDLMTLHCTIDHFEGDADTGFVGEAARLLRPGGRACVLPLYVAGEATNVCDPARYARSIRFDADATVRAVPGYGNRFGRFYSIETLRRRLIDPARRAGLAPTIHRVGGERADIANNYLHYALVLARGV